MRENEEPPAASRAPEAGAQSPSSAGEAAEHIGGDERQLPPLRVSAALIGWGRGLAALGTACLVLIAIGLAWVLAVLSRAAWTVDAMIAISGVPVFVAVLWVVRRALGPAGEGFVQGVTSTYLVSLAPPSRPASLASPAAALRALRLWPALALVAALGAIVALGDVVVFIASHATAVRIGALAVTCDGLGALAALALALGWGIGGLGRAIAAREHTLGVRFYALAAPADGQSDDDEPGGMAVCAVPGQG
jgi:hypothetical protein